MLPQESRWMRSSVVARHARERIFNNFTSSLSFAFSVGSPFSSLTSITVSSSVFGSAPSPSLSPSDMMKSCASPNSSRLSSFAFSSSLPSSFFAGSLNSVVLPLSPAYSMCLALARFPPFACPLFISSMSLASWASSASIFVGFFLVCFVGISIFWVFSPSSSSSS